jgi:hypothetical protein
MATVAETRTSDYVCYATWSGADTVPVEPDASYLFIDTTTTVPLPQCGDVYDPLAETWTYTQPPEF